MKKFDFSNINYEDQKNLEFFIKQHKEAEKIILEVNKFYKGFLMSRLRTFKQIMEQPSFSVETFSAKTRFFGSDSINQYTSIEERKKVIPRLLKSKVLFLQTSDNKIEEFGLLEHLDKMSFKLVGKEWLVCSFECTCKQGGTASFNRAYITVYTLKLNFYFERSTNNFLRFEEETLDSSSHDAGFGSTFKCFTEYI